MPPPPYVPPKDPPHDWGMILGNIFTALAVGFIVAFPVGAVFWFLHFGSLNTWERETNALSYFSVVLWIAVPISGFALLQFLGSIYPEARARVLEDHENRAKEAHAAQVSEYYLSLINGYRRVLSPLYSAYSETVRKRAELSAEYAQRQAEVAVARERRQKRCDMLAHVLNDKFFVPFVRDMAWLGVQSESEIAARFIRERLPEFVREYRDAGLARFCSFPLSEPMRRVVGALPAASPHIADAIAPPLPPLPIAKVKEFPRADFTHHYYPYGNPSRDELESYFAKGLIRPRVPDNDERFYLRDAFF